MHLASIEHPHRNCSREPVDQNPRPFFSGCQPGPRPGTPNHATLRASVRNIASRLPSAAQVSFPPQRPNVPQQASHSPSGSRPAPSSNINPTCQEKGKEELRRVHTHHRLIRSGPPPQWTRISRDTRCQLHLPHYLATLRHSPTNIPTPGKQKNLPRGSSPPAPLGPLVISTPTGDPPPP